MPKPFVLIQVEDGSVSETTIVGVADMVPIVVDWDTVDGDEAKAQDLIDEIVGRYPNLTEGSEVALVVERLEEIIQAVRDEEDEEDEEEEELFFDDEDELDLDENFKQVD